LAAQENTRDVAVTAAAPTPKPGVFTSEFYLTIMPWVAMFGVFVLVGIGKIDADQAVLICSALGLGGSYASGRYTDARATVKGGGG
jgi:hypothetical protein